MSKTSEPARLIRRPAVLDRTGLKTSALYEKMAAGDFPKPVTISARSVGWVEQEVDDWIRARIAARDETRQ